MNTITKFTLDYIDVIDDAGSQLGELEQMSLHDAATTVSTVCGNLRQLCSGRALPLAEDLIGDEASEHIRAVHFGYIEEGIRPLVNNGSVYFDMFVFQEYLTRGVEEAALDWARCFELRANLSELANLRALVEMERVIILPNAAFDQYAASPPDIRSRALSTVGQYVLPTFQLSALLGAIPYTTWSQLEAPVFGAFRDELRTRFSVHPEVTRSMWQASLTIDVFREVMRGDSYLPYLGYAEIQDVLDMRERFALFRDALRVFSVVSYADATKHELADAVARVADALRDSLKAVGDEAHEGTRNAVAQYAVGNLLTILGLAPSALMTLLCAAGSFLTSTLSLWSHFEVDKRTADHGGNLLFEGLSMLNARGKQRVCGDV